MKIIIIKTSSFGDIIHAFTPLGYLREKFPEAEIHWVVEADCAELLQAHPGVDRVFTVDTRKWRKAPFTRQSWKEFFQFRKRLREKCYDFALDFQGNLKSGLLLSQVRARTKVGFGRKSVAEWPNLLFSNLRFSPPQGLNIREEVLYLAQKTFNDRGEYRDKEVILTLSVEEKERLEEILSQFKAPCPVLVAPGAAWSAKELPSSHLIEYLRRLMQEKKGIFFLFSWGTEREKRRSKHLSSHFTENSLFLPPLSLPLLQGLMRKMQLVISMDSLPLHLAGTTTTPTLGFFGPTLPQKYAPLGAQHKWIYGECPLGVSFTKRCPKLRGVCPGHCIQNLSPAGNFKVFSP